MNSVFFFEASHRALFKRKHLTVIVSLNILTALQTLGDLLSCCGETGEEMPNTHPHFCSVVLLRLMTSVFLLRAFPQHALVTVADMLLWSVASPGIS